MASGFGVSGGIGRCYPIWTEYRACIATKDNPTSCKDFKDDYVECLHHRKEFERYNKVAAEWQRQQETKKIEESKQDNTEVKYTLPHTATAN